MRSLSSALQEPITWLWWDCSPFISLNCAPSRSDFFLLCHESAAFLPLCFQACCCCGLCALWWILTFKRLKCGSNSPWRIQVHKIVWKVKIYSTETFTPVVFFSLSAYQHFQIILLWRHLLEETDFTAWNSTKWFNHLQFIIEEMIFRLKQVNFFLIALWKYHNYLKNKISEWH